MNCYKCGGTSGSIECRRREREAKKEKMPQESSEEKIFWLSSSVENKPYAKTTWYRCMKGEEFVKRVEEKNKIVGVIFSHNDIGFILDEK